MTMKSICFCVSFLPPIPMLHFISFFGRVSWLRTSWLFVHNLAAFRLQLHLY